MSAEPKHGFNGDPPEFVASRDLVGKDARTLPDLWNVATDRLNWLLAHKRISKDQWDAGVRLQRDNEMAQIGGFSTLQGVGGGSETSRLSEAKCDAISRVNRARVHVGNSGWRIIELVVFENISLGKAEARMRMSAGSGIGALTTALDSLAAHYGLA